MIKWEDTTSYSRNQERIPTCFSAKIGGLRISVLTGHIYYRDEWVMHCRPWFDTFQLKVETEEEAKEKAIQIVFQKVEKLYNAFLDALNT